MVLLPVLFTRMWCASIIPYLELLAIKINAIGNKKKLQLHTDQTFFLPREGTRVKKLNVTSQPCPHPHVLYSKNIQKYWHETVIL